MFDKKKEPTAAEIAENAEIAAKNAEEAEETIHNISDAGEKISHTACEAYGERIHDGAVYVADHVKDTAIHGSKLSRNYLFKYPWFL